MENGVVEKPYRPTLRMFTPVFLEGKRIGILGVNINAHVLLNDLSREGIILLNRSGIVFSGEDAPHGDICKGVQLAPQFVKNISRTFKMGGVRIY